MDFGFDRLSLRLNFKFDRLSLKIAKPRLQGVNQCCPSALAIVARDRLSGVRMPQHDLTTPTTAPAIHIKFARRRLPRLVSLFPSKVNGLDISGSPRDFLVPWIEWIAPI